jgi:ABC-type molybdate transport system substrate-binding protein
MSRNPIRRGLLLAIILGFLATPFVWASAQAADITVFAASSCRRSAPMASSQWQASTRCPPANTARRH